MNKAISVSIVLFVFLVYLIFGLGMVSAGQVSGRVTDAKSNPLPDIWVDSYYQDPSNGWWYFYDGTFTNWNGYYTLGELLPNTYRVCFDDYYSGRYAQERYKNALNVERAADIQVTASSVIANIDALLERGGRITGTVTDNTGDPLFDHWVHFSIWDSNSGLWIGTGGAFTDQNGKYVSSGLTPGTYRVCFYDFSAQLYATECYDNALNIDNATDVQVTVGSTTEDINAHLALGGRITGRVTNSKGGQSVEGVWIVAFRYDSGEWVNESLSDGLGNFVISGLPAGDYRITVDNFEMNFLEEYFDNARSWDDASRITVTAGATVSGIDIALDYTLPHTLIPILILLMD